MGASFERIIIIMLENSTRQDVLDNTYMRNLRKKGVFLANAYGVTHSSQPNYIASTGGDTLGFLDDTPGYAQWIYSKPSDDPQPPPVNHIADLLEAQGLTWKNYAEDLPDGYTAACAKYYQDYMAACVKYCQDYHEYMAVCANHYPGIPPPIPPISPIPKTPPDEGNFARKHVPFLSYPNVVTNPKRLANIVNADQFEKDLNAGTLPHYSWYTPNMIHDGHSLTSDQKQADPKDTNRNMNIANIAAFLEGFLGNDPVAKFPAGTLIVVTFDEAYPYSDPYEIYTLLIGDMLEAGTTRFEPYNHYSMLRSVEINFNLCSLNRNDASALPWWFLRPQISLEMKQKNKFSIRAIWKKISLKLR